MLWRRGLLAFGGVVLLGLIVACGGGDDPTPTTAAPTATSPAPTATSPVVPGETQVAPTPTATAVPTPAWEVEWDRLVEAAKEEGVVVVGVSRAAYRNSAESFLEAFPDIRLEALTGSSSTLTQRFLVEYEAGIHSLDMTLTDSTGALRVLLPYLESRGEPILGDTRAQFFRPDVTGDENWIGSFEDRFMDKPTNTYAFTWLAWGSGGANMYVNRDKAPPEVFSAIDDLFKPELKGKWCILDPVSQGSATGWVMNRITTRGEEYARRVLTETDPLIGSSSRELARELMDGNVWVCQGSYMEDFWEEGVGLHVEAVYPEAEPLLPKYTEAGVASNCCGTGSGLPQIEGTWSSATGGPILMGGAPNPNAAKLFLNYMATLDGQIGWMEPLGRRDCSARIELHSAEFCDRPLLEEGHSYLNLDRTDVLWIEQEAIDLVRDIYGGR